MKNRGEFLEMTMTSLADMMEELSEESPGAIGEDYIKGRNSAFKQAAKFIKMRIKSLDEMYHEK